MERPIYCPSHRLEVFVHLNTAQLSVGQQTSSAPCHQGALALQVAKRAGVKIEVIPEDDKGDIDIEALQGLCSQGQKPSLIAITHIPTNCGGQPSKSAVGGRLQPHEQPLAR